MKIEIDNKVAPKFKPFTLNLTVESEDERLLLSAALRHYALKHTRGDMKNYETLRAVAVALDGVK